MVKLLFVFQFQSGCHIQFFTPSKQQRQREFLSSLDVILHDGTTSHYTTNKNNWMSNFSRTNAGVSVSCQEGEPN